MRTARAAAHPRHLWVACVWGTVATVKCVTAEAAACARLAAAAPSSSCQCLPLSLRSEPAASLHTSPCRQEQNMACMLTVDTEHSY